MSAETPLGPTMAGKEKHTVATVFFFKAESKQTSGRDGCAAVPRTEGNISSDALQNMLVCI